MVSAESHPGFVIRLAAAGSAAVLALWSSMEVIPPPTPVTLGVVGLGLLALRFLGGREVSGLALFAPVSVWFFATFQSSPGAYLGPPFLPTLVLFGLVLTATLSGTDSSRFRPATLLSGAAATVFIHPFGQDTTAYRNYPLAALVFVLAPHLLSWLSAPPTRQWARAYAVVEPLVSIALASLLALPLLKEPSLSYLWYYYLPCFGLPAALATLPALAATHKRVLSDA